MSADSRANQLREELLEELRGTNAAPKDDSSLFQATVVGVNDKDVLLELGPRTQGAVPREEFAEAAPEVGSTLAVSVVGRDEGLWLFSSTLARQIASREEIAVGVLVKGRVIGVNKGGLELKVDGGVNAFLPASQIGMGHVEDLTTLAGESYVCEVLEVDASRNRIVVSRRAVLEAEARQKREDAASALVEGSILRGKVSRLESYGAFVDIGGVEGLLHVSNISHTRVEHPSEKLKTGQDVEVQVLKIEEGGRRIGLGMKQLEADPWEVAADSLREDEVREGTVRRLVDFGAFVELMPGVDGLLHVSQLGAGRVNRASDVLKVGETLSVRVLSIDSYQRRISLSRLDARGALLGSEESAAGEEIQNVLSKGGSIGTNLGSLFADALKKKD